jgi:multisubunit Na+/H+ antiporter MnhB subunit
MPHKWTPLFVFFPSFIFLVASISMAVVLSHTFALDWETYVRMRAQSADATSPTASEMFVLWTYTSNPWLGLLWGALCGTVMIIAVSAAKRRHIEHAADMLLRRKRSIRELGDRRNWILMTVVLGSVFVNLAGAYLLNVSIKTSIPAHAIPFFLAYGTERKVYALARLKYGAALEKGLIPDGSLNPSRSQRASFLVGLSLCMALSIGFISLVVMMWSGLGEFYDTQLSMVGSTRTPKEAQVLEKQLDRNPGDRDTHVILAWYYAGARFEVPVEERDDTREAYYRHTLWLIQYAPECWASVLLFPRDGDAYVEARRLWLGNVETRANEPQVLMNAARFFDETEPEIAEEILRKGKTLEPDNLEWDARLNKLEGTRGERTEGWN